jgi:hypothetical protein
MTGHDSAGKEERQRKVWWTKIGHVQFMLRRAVIFVRLGVSSEDSKYIHLETVVVRDVNV